MYRTRYDIADATLVAKACSSVPDHSTYKRLHGCTPNLPCWRVGHAVRVFSFARRSRLQTYRKNGKWYVRFKDVEAISKKRGMSNLAIAGSCQI
jgi:hypothetical protein